MNILNIRKLSKAFGPDVLFEDISFSIDAGEKIAVVGPNGCGKSTLFRILVGDLEPDDGILARQRDATIGYLPQDPVFEGEASPRSVVAQALGPLRDSLAAYAEAAARIAEASPADLPPLLESQSLIEQEIERRGGWAWEHRVDEMVQALRIDAWVDTPMANLSGGQRRRVGLARALLENPDLLILDEPTNHLDAETVEWLEQALIDYPGALLLVTHDRYFLDRVVDRIIEMAERRVFTHPGGYPTYVERKIERMRQRARTDERRLRLLERELEWLGRSPKARTSKSQHRVKQTQALTDKARTRAAESRDSRLSVSFQANKRLGADILEGRGLYKRYDDNVVLEDVGVTFNRGDKIGLVGPNGCGKSTLLRILVGDERPDAGVVDRGKSTRVGYLSQDRDGLDPNRSVYEALREGDYVWHGDRKIHKRAFLDGFLFSAPDQRRPVNALSGGEQCRLLLARLVLDNANLLVLDEPTNDLDITSLQVLEDALAAFQGSVLVVTHDRYFLNRVCNVIVAVDDEEGWIRYNGDYDFYRQLRTERAQRQRSATLAAREQAIRSQPGPDRPAGPKKLTLPERKELDSMEGRIEAAESSKAELESDLVDPALYRDHPERVRALRASLSEAEEEIEGLYARWEALEARARCHQSPIPIPIRNEETP